MADEVTLRPEDELKELGDNLLASVIRSDEVSRFNRRTLFGQLSPKVFREENYLIYYVLYQFKDKGFSIDDRFLSMYLERHVDIIKSSKEYITESMYSDLDEDPAVGYIVGTMKQFTRLLTLPIQSTDDFGLTLEKFKTMYSCEEINNAYGTSKAILYQGVQIGRKFYFGYTDSVSYVKKKIADIEAVLDQTTGIGFINSREAAIVDNEKAKPEKIGDFDLIDELNERLGGIFTSQFYSVLAPTKGGKSKFCARLAHTMIVKYGVNISVWAHEGGHEAWWAQLRAIHYEYTYIRNKSGSEKIAPLSQNDILTGNYPNEAIRGYEEASRLDLFTNENYGNVYMIDRPFVAETFIEDIETSVQLNNSKAIVIDYLQLISSNDSRRQKSQVIGRAYQDFLAYLKKRNVAGVSPAQFTQDFMDEMAHSKDGQNHEVRTAGGESSEIIRTPDVNIALYATIEDIMRHEMTIMSVPSRLSAPFPDIRIYADLCSCVFSSMGTE